MNDAQLAPTALGGIVPNPARGGVARVHFTLHDAGRVAFDVLDIAGRRVAHTEPRTWEPGRWSTTWRPEGGGSMSPGIYFVTMSVEGRVVARRKFTVLN